MPDQQPVPSQSERESEPLAFGQIRENPHNGHRCVIFEVVDDTHAEAHWFGWPHSGGKQDVGWTTFLRMADFDVTEYCRGLPSRRP